MCSLYAFEIFRLYVSVTPSVLRNGSKEAFVSLLEYAEDVLEVTHVIVCCQPSDVSSNNPDNKSVLRNFMFLGFQPLAPGHQFMPSNPNLVRNHTFLTFFYKRNIQRA